MFLDLELCFEEIVMKYIHTFLDPLMLMLFVQQQPVLYFGETEMIHIRWIQDL